MVKWLTDVAFFETITALKATTISGDNPDLSPAKEGERANLFNWCLVCLGNTLVSMLVT